MGVAFPRGFGQWKKPDVVAPRGRRRPCEPMPAAPAPSCDPSPGRRSPGQPLLEEGAALSPVNIWTGGRVGRGLSGPIAFSPNEGWATDFGLQANGKLREIVKVSL